MPLLSKSPLEFDIEVQTRQIRYLSRIYRVSPQKIHELIGLTLAGDGSPNKSSATSNVFRASPKNSLTKPAGKSGEAEVDPMVRELKQRVDDALSRLERMDVEG